MILALKIFITLYALLQGAAIIEQVQAGPFLWYYSLYVIFAGILIYAVWPEIKLPWLIVGLLGLVLVAAYTGVVTDTFQWSHIIVRSVISLALVLVAYYL